jgi:protocatechuate 3,4-dioxygenase beta subunit
MAQKLDECAVTPELWSVGVLPAAENSNDLTQNYTSFESAQGVKMAIKGKVLDRDCVPVGGAKVSVWQANPKGIFQFNEKDGVDFDKHFRSSGSIITNNLGDFEFITVYPGKVKNLNPNIIFRVEHPNFIAMETKMFFPEYNNTQQIKNINSSIITKQIPSLIAKKIGKEDGMLIYSFTITLNQLNSYKEY